MTLKQWKDKLPPDVYDKMIRDYAAAKYKGISKCSIWDSGGLPVPEKEYKFHPTRKWRLDYAFANVKLAIEIEGGAFTRGRHTRPMGFIKDMEKYNALTMAGWALLRYLPNKIDYQQIKQVYMMRLETGF